MIEIATNLCRAMSLQCDDCIEILFSINWFFIHFCKVLGLLTNVNPEGSDKLQKFMINFLGKGCLCMKWY